MAQTRRALSDITNVQQNGLAKLNAAATRLGSAPPSPTSRAAGSRLPAVAALGQAADMSGVVDLEQRFHKDGLRPYLKECLQYLRGVEMKTRTITYFQNFRQTEITERMRAILVDWLVEVHAKFKLLPETLWLTVDLTDRFLEKKMVSRAKLQLVGITAMFIAAKFQEIYPPEVRDFVFMSANVYSRGEVLRMELQMLHELDYVISVPTSFCFIEPILLVADKASPHYSNLARYFAELSLWDYGATSYPPSMVAAAAVFLALAYHKQDSTGIWDANLTHHVGYTLDDLKGCITMVLKNVRNTPTARYQAVYNKYKSTKPNLAALALEVDHHLIGCDVV